MYGILFQIEALVGNSRHHPYTRFEPHDLSGYQAN